LKRQEFGAFARAPLCATRLSRAQMRVPDVVVLSLGSAAQADEVIE
jgi:hypothetical protein